MILILILIWLEYKFFNINLFKYRSYFSSAKLCDLYERFIRVIFLWPQDQRYAKLKQLYLYLLKHKGQKDGFGVWLGIIWELLNYFMFGIIFKLIIKVTFIIILIILVYLFLNYLYKRGLF